MRYRSTSDYFASTATTQSITTSKATHNTLTPVKAETANKTYFVVTGTTYVNPYGSFLTAEYTDEDMQNLKSEIRNAERKGSVVTTLDVFMDIEKDDVKNYRGADFTMPSGTELLQLRLYTPYLTVVRSNNTTHVRVEEDPSDYAIRDWKKGKSHIYKITTSNSKRSSEIVYPWAFPSRADLQGLVVYYTDTNGKNSTTLKYVECTEGIRFTIPGDGYIAINNQYRDYGTLPFTDSQTTWAYSYIYYAYENGIVNGVGENLFAPDNKVTRAQLMVLMARMKRAGTMLYSEVESKYTDVPKGAWYHDAVVYLETMGYLDNYKEKTLNPTGEVTREEVAYMLCRIFPYRGTIWRVGSYTDRDKIGTYALNAVDSLYTLGIMVGDDNKSFRPTDSLSRAELVTILYRLDNTLV